jgi:plastocyanin
MNVRPLRDLGVGLVAVAALVAFAACGSDDGADVRGSGSASGSASGSGSASASAPEEAACNPVGTDLADDADQTVDVTLRDYAFDPSTIAVDAGVVTFHASNEGDENHELAVLPGGGDVPLNDDGDPDEDALADAGAFELEAFPPGESCDATFELEPGTYTLFCIVTAEDGETHAAKGMVGELTVS